MKYHDYIANYNARREREQQLANQYNQKPEGRRVQNLWMVSMEKHSGNNVTVVEIAKIIFGIAIVAAILILSIWL